MSNNKKTYNQYPKRSDKLVRCDRSDIYTYDYNSSLNKEEKQYIKEFNNYYTNMNPDTSTGIFDGFDDTEVKGLVKDQRNHIRNRHQDLMTSKECTRQDIDLEEDLSYEHFEGLDVDHELIQSVECIIYYIETEDFDYNTLVTSQYHQVVVDLADLIDYTRNQMKHYKGTSERVKYAKLYKWLNELYNQIQVGDPNG